MLKAKIGSLVAKKYPTKYESREKIVEEINKLHEEIHDLYEKTINDLEMLFFKVEVANILHNGNMYHQTMENLKIEARNIITSWNLIKEQDIRQRKEKISKLRDKLLD